MTLKNRLQSFHYSTPSISQRNLMKLSILIERLDAKIDSSFELEDDMTEDLANYVLPRFYSQSGDLNYKDLKSWVNIRLWQALNNNVWIITYNRASFIEVC